MKFYNKISFLIVCFTSFMGSSLIAQQYWPNDNSPISGAVDANGQPTQTLAQVVGNANAKYIQLGSVHSGITIENLIIDASGEPFGIVAYGNNVLNNVTINNVIIKNVNGSGILIDKCTNIKVSNSSIFNNNNDGIYGDGVTGLVVENSSIYNNCLSQDISVATWVGIDDGYGVYNGDGVDIPNAGIRIKGYEGVDNELIGNNVYGNNGHGIFVFDVYSDDLNGDGYKSIISQNIIGLDPLGEPEGNFGAGILIQNSFNILIDGNQSVANGNRRVWDGAIGDIGVDANSGLDNENFFGSGIDINRSSYNTITNNIIGVRLDAGDAYMTSVNGDSLGNHKHGIFIRDNSTYNIIGAANKGNIVGGNGFAFNDVHTNDSDPGSNYLFAVGHGIALTDNATNNNIQGNDIGFYNGSCIPNSQDGVSLLGYGGDVSGNLIGGATIELGNVIGGGEFAIFAQGAAVGENDKNVIQGNFIGVDKNLLPHTCVPNTGGIYVQNDAVNIEIKENVISNIATAITVSGDGTNAIEITDNILTCNEIGIELDESNGGFGNSGFGVDELLLAVNTIESSEDTIVGFTPHASDIIDVYIADSCSRSDSNTCQAGGDAEAAQGVRYLSSFQAVDIPEGYKQENRVDGRKEQGYFEFDLTDMNLDPLLNHDNIIFLARDSVGNTSEFHKCVALELCAPIVLSFEGPNKSCVGESITLAMLDSESNSASENDTYEWILSSIDGDSLLNVTENSADFLFNKEGEYTVSVLATTPIGCVSDTTEFLVNVYAIPSVPGFSGSTNFCQDEDSVMFTISPSNDSSTYSWSYTMSDANLVSGSLDVGPGNDSLIFDLGSESGQLTVIETLNGCVSSASTHSVNVKKNLGSNSKNTLEGICSGVAYDSLAKYEIDVVEATGITFFTDPSFLIDSGVVEGSGTRKSFEVVFPENIEDTQVSVYAEVVSVNASGVVCDIDTIYWDSTYIQPSEIVAIEILQKDICEGSTGEFVAKLNPDNDFDTSGVYSWFIDGEFETLGDTLLIPDVSDRTLIELEYQPSTEVCVNINDSDLDGNVSAFVIAKKEVAVNANLLTNSNVIFEGEDVDGYNVYSMSSKVNVDVQAELGFFSSSDIYSYVISYDQEDTELIVEAEGQFTDNTFEYNHSTQGMNPGDENGESVRWYYVTASTDGECSQSATDSLKLIVKYSVNIPDLVCVDCPENGPEWEISNIEEFPNHEVVIFNRWGNIVRTYSDGSYDNANGWDGTNESGKELPVGTYFFTIDLGNGSDPFRGTITMIR